MTSFCGLTGRDLADPNAITIATAASILLTDRCFDNQALSHLSFSTTADMNAEIRTGFLRKRNGHFQTFITSKQLFICLILKFRSIAMKQVVVLWSEFRLLL